MADTFLKFPDGFLWGTATSTTQIEGHIQNEWNDFVARDGRTCHPAGDSYHRYAEDVEWMQRLGVNAYRFGIEWSRLQDQAFGPLNQKELARYCDQLDRLNTAGIAPMVVLHHFSNPPWINQAGGWTNAATIPAFVDYVTKLVTALRDRVRFWNTFNEPDTYACCGYLIAEFPPLKKFRVDSFRTVIRNMAEAHRQICPVIRNIGSGIGSVEAGFSKNWTFFEAYRQSSLWDVAIAAFAHSQINEFVLESFLEGGGHSAATFLGVNYYGRIRFRNLQPLVPTFGFSCDELAELGVQCDDMLERHPLGLESALKHLARECPLPIYITEHGSASSNEAFRERDLRDNLAAVHRAIDHGIDIRGFFYWSLLDNFEWQFGYTKKFGLVSVDFADASLPRRMKPLGEVYRNVSCRNGISIR
ncbi:MAG TPA: family 1 glycosylhydrolase [Candidatus Paceibacterota bacterium]|nr:family 1 glycosylhydrolase [Candidatus Paceibacterota bacterium]